MPLVCVHREASGDLLTQILPITAANLTLDGSPMEAACRAASAFHVDLSLGPVTSPSPVRSSSGLRSLRSAINHSFAAFRSLGVTGAIDWWRNKATWTLLLLIPYSSLSYPWGGYHRHRLIRIKHWCVFTFWRMHKGLECLARKINHKIPPLMIFDQIAYKLKYIIESLFSLNYFLLYYYLLILYSSIII